MATYDTEIGRIEAPVDRFFAFARERQTVALRRRMKQSKPWTGDPILQSFSFTNVFREMDKTTRWFREKVRGPLSRYPEVLLATIVFRWFNRIVTGEAMFLQRSIPVEDASDVTCANLVRANLEGTAFDRFLVTGEVAQLRNAIVEFCGAKGPFVTGAYTINTISAGLGKSKLDGVLELIRQWVSLHPDWHDRAEEMIHHGSLGGQTATLQRFCAWAESPCLGPFMTYEVACDLRWTDVLVRAPDVDTWANPGPGAQRGLRRMEGYSAEIDVRRTVREDEAVRRMCGLLELSRHKACWQQSSGWERWELREVEHTLCEWDKYERTRLGQGRPRGAFNGR